MSNILYSPDVMEEFGEIPIAPFQELLHPVVEAIQLGKIAIISGMCGVGKTEFFAKRVAENTPIPELNFVRRLSDDDSFQLASNLGGRGPVLFDEASHAGNRPEKAAVIAEVVDSGLLICAGLRKTKTRDAARHGFVEAFNNRDKDVVDFRDVGVATKDDAALAAFLEKYGFEDELIRFISAHPVLRNPRFIHRIVFRAARSDETIKTLDGFRDLIMGLETGGLTQEKRQQHAPFIWTINCDIKKLEPPYGKNHLLYTQAFYRYVDAQELYRLFELKFPDDDEIDEGMKLYNGIDPRLKT